MRKSGVPGAALRATRSAEGPGPAIVRPAANRSGRALDRAIVPVTDGANVIVYRVVITEEDGDAASVIAARSVPGPESAGLVTGIVTRANPTDSNAPMSG